MAPRTKRASLYRGKATPSISTSQKKGRRFSSAQAHQHVGQSKFGYKKTYIPGKGFRMQKD